MACKRILVVEDDEDIRLNMVLALEAESYQVYQAEHGRKALEVLAKLTPDLLPACILLDLMMPEMDGKTFLEEIHANYSHSWAKIPVIIATAKGSSSFTAQVPSVAAKIQKPMDLDTLYRVVKKHCGECESGRSKKPEDHCAN